jgi:hypothetical protein
MKRNLSKVVLIVEIITIALLHTMKIRNNQNTAISKITPAKSISGPSPKANYIFLKIK